MEQSTSVNNPIAKAGTALGGAFVVSSWSDIAAFLAAVYSAILLLEWVWKRVGRPFCEQRGWIRRLKRRVDDTLQ